MAELEIELARHLDISDLEIQVAWYDEDLVIVYNRPQDEHLNYPDLIKKTITKLHSLKVKPPKTVTFYSRKLGTEEIDWQKTINIRATEQPKTASPATSEEVPDTPVDTPEPVSSSRQLADFCFTRNKALVKADLPPPDRKIAENVKFFHELDERTKLELAPLLESFCKSPDKVSLASVPSEFRQWFENLKNLQDAEFKSQAVWLSRYCYDRDKTMTTINDLFAILEKRHQEKPRLSEPTATAKQAKQEVAEPVSQPQPRKRVVSSSSSRRQSSSQPASMGSQRFSSDELGYMILGGLLIAGIGWFLWGTANAFGVIGYVAAIASVGSGVSGVIGNDTLKAISGVVLLIIFLIFFFVPFVGLIILWIEFLGWLIGLVWGGMIKQIAKSSGALSLTAPKPLRLSVVFMIVLLLGMGYAITKSANEAEVSLSGSSEIGTPLSRSTVVITDQAITISNTELRTPFALDVENRASKDCDIDFELEESGFFAMKRDSESLVKKGEKKTIKFQISDPVVLRFECKNNFSEPNLLRLRGPVFTVRDR